MNKLGSLLTATVLTLVTVIPLAASPARDPATATSTPIVPTPTPTPPVVKPLESSGRYEPEEMEEVRRALLDVLDVLDELYPYAETHAQVSGTELPPMVSRQQIQGLSHQELHMLREAFGGREEYQSFLDNVAALKSLVLTPENEPSVAGEDLGPSLSSFAANSSPPLTSIGIIPAPTPVSTPPPGIQHDSNHIEQVNEDLGDFPPPNYYWGCPKTRFDARLVLANIVLADVARAAKYIADIVTCQGTLLVIALPFGGGTNIPGCVIAGVVKGLSLVTDSILEGLNFCIWAVDRVELKAALENTERIHAELHMHDQNLTTRFNWTDNDLFHFRNLNLRSRIEGNLASPEDDPIALFTLPGDVCITTDLEVVNANNPRFSSARIAGCGLLEVVSDTVRSAIDMTMIAGGSVNNAEAEFSAAVDHYNSGQWKLSYARFRKAYREAVRP